ncbi:unnamed protein product [Clonostachys rhizophaga]|uniref:Uncharacterized protein n=1 Tax=Clonostachys rhizophaga TaxID=160324 RepID=A0A9N9VLV0_9HYPO|nr:unnamed protein product [Clonostachys rhizophaga]
MESSGFNSEAQTYSSNLDYTLKELQKKVKDHELELAKLKARHGGVISSPAVQVQVINNALETATNSEPFMPFPGSVLPALLALRKTHETINESRAYLASQSAVADGEKRELESELTRLKDQSLLTEALDTRIKSLEQELTSTTETDPEDGLRERQEELQQKKKRYDVESKQLFKSLRQFIDEHLAPMLAAEDLGGPIVGDMMDIDQEDLESGFNAQGKPKRAKAGDGVEKGQRRLDEIWGDGGEGRQDRDSEDKTAAAGSEMKQLLQALVQQLDEAKGDNSRSYVKLARESAAARFLVRSQVAQFHPKDASRLRLVDFGRELDA